MSIRKAAIFGAILILIGGFSAPVLSRFDFDSFMTTMAYAQKNTNNAEKSAGHDHEIEAEHGEHETHKDNDHDEDMVRMTKQELDEFGVELENAAGGAIRVSQELPGEIVMNPDRVAHVVPRVPGIVREVYKGIGDQVQAGDALALIDSRELAVAKAEYLAAQERIELESARYQREESLWRKKISSEQDYLEAKQGLAEARIERRLAEQKLHAIGFSEQYLKKLPDLPDASLTEYRIVAPIGGTIVDKHVTLGEKLDESTSIFTIADLDEVWAMLTVYLKDIDIVKPGQKVTIHAEPGDYESASEINYVSPIIEEASRTATARVVLRNADGKWRPGMFVVGLLETQETEVDFIVPKTALQTFEGRDVVFVETEEGFKPQPVQIGRSDRTHVEIISGIDKGMKYVSKNSFTLKAELSKGAFGSGHAH